MCLLSHFSHIQLCTTLWTVACQAPLYMGFSRQEYWNGLPFPSPGIVPNPELEPMFPALAGRFFTTYSTCEAWFNVLESTKYFRLRITYFLNCCKNKANWKIKKILQMHNILKMFISSVQLLSHVWLWSHGL